MLLTEALLVVVGKDSFVELVGRGQPSLRPEAIWVVEVVCIMVCRPLEDGDNGLRVHVVQSVLEIALLKSEVTRVGREERKVGMPA